MLENPVIFFDSISVSVRLISDHFVLCFSVGPKPKIPKFGKPNSNLSELLGANIQVLYAYSETRRTEHSIRYILLLQIYPPTSEARRRGPSWGCEWKLKIRPDIKPNSEVLQNRTFRTSQKRTEHRGPEAQHYSALCFEEAPVIKRIFERNNYQRWFMLLAGIFECRVRCKKQATSLHTPLWWPFLHHPFAFLELAILTSVASRLIFVPWNVTNSYLKQ